MRLLLPLVARIKSVCEFNCKLHYQKYSLVVSFNGKPVVRFESLYRYGYQFLYGTIVVDDVRSESEFREELLPNFLKVGDAKLGYRVTKKQGCIRNVTGSVFVKYVEYLSETLKRFSTDD